MTVLSVVLVYWFNKCVVFSTNVVLLVISGEKKLGKVITPDTWKDGARNTTGELRTQIQ